jgi:hypothetical protein
MAGELASLSLSSARGEGLAFLEGLGLIALTGVMAVRVATYPGGLTGIGKELSVEVQ